jgi:hypothetical protein
MGQLLQRWHRQQCVSRARQLHSCAVPSVVAFQARGQATQGRHLSTLAPPRALRARTFQSAWARRVVGKGVRSCPRAGCGRSTCPVRRAGHGDGAWPHRRTKGAATDMFDLQQPRHTSTLPLLAIQPRGIFQAGQLIAERAVGGYRADKMVGWVGHLGNVGKSRLSVGNRLIHPLISDLSMSGSRRIRQGRRTF